MEPSATSDPKYGYDDPEVNYGPPGYRQSGYGPSQQMTSLPPASGISSSNVTVVVNQPTAATQNQLMVTTLDGNRTWTTGLFDCFSDMATCKLFITFKLFGCNSFKSY